jgi:hypothetical protein
MVQSIAVYRADPAWPAIKAPAPHYSSIQQMPFAAAEKALIIGEWRFVIEKLTRTFETPDRSIR